MFDKLSDADGGASPLRMPNRHHASNISHGSSRTMLQGYSPKKMQLSSRVHQKTHLQKHVAQSTVIHLKPTVRTAVNSAKGSHVGLAQRS